MLRIANLSFPLDFRQEDFLPVVQRKLRVPASDILSVRLARQSVDARDKNDVHYVLALDVELRHEAETLKRLRPGIAERHSPKPIPRLPLSHFERRPLVVGAGPAGLFAALTLAQAGAKPILIERGKAVEERAADVARMCDEGMLNTESNIQFGEGGAGAFSDGKLTTGIKSPYQQAVLKTLTDHGAPEEILVLQKPHIGTDLLRGVVAGIRRHIIELGGEVHFSTRLTGLITRGSRIEGIQAQCGDEAMEWQTDTVLLCIGHSARDTMQALFTQGVRMVQKPFAIGVRIEHPQRLINQSQYGRFAGHPALRPAEYKLAVHTPDQRGVYTFCMCPGGWVIPAASQEGGLVVNGMSYHARDGENANAALLVGIRTEDFGDDHPLAGFVTQRAIEQAAYRAGGGAYRAPVQRVEDFLAGRPTLRLGDVCPSYRPGVTPADLRDVLPAWIIEDLRLGIRQMDHQLHGFAHPDAVLTGVETRSSSPVRIPRLTDGMSESLEGLFPVGEGAGYAGGIVSAAVDGINAARAALEHSGLFQRT